MRRGRNLGYSHDKLSHGKNLKTNMSQQWRQRKVRKTEKVLIHQDPEVCHRETCTPVMDVAKKHYDRVQLTNRIKKSLQEGLTLLLTSPGELISSGKIYLMLCQ